MKKQYTKKQITEAIVYWEKQLKTGNYRRVNEELEKNLVVTVEDLLNALEDNRSKVHFLTVYAPAIGTIEKDAWNGPGDLKEQYYSYFPVEDIGLDSDGENVIIVFNRKGGRKSLDEIMHFLKHMNERGWGKTPVHLSNNGFDLALRGKYPFFEFGNGCGILKWYDKSVLRNLYNMYPH